MYNQLRSLEHWRRWSSLATSKGWPKGSKKPQQQKRSQDQKQLEKLTEVIRSWYAIHESYHTIPQAMQQMGWWADPKRVWDLLHALNRPTWKKFVRQVCLDNLPLIGE